MTKPKKAQDIPAPQNERVQRHVNGAIFSGELNYDAKEFTVTKIKNIPAQSVIKHRQLQAIRNYLTKTKGSQHSYTITINDQIPLLLNTTEVEQLVNELEAIDELLH
ncbi:hypothetical protein P9597_23435 [Aneurinibacillus migulanus]|uniref:hypothetical protein n=1 Tax=Aneurinibacillus migulanus TaxID=47500 RepID=UPI002E2283F8|nr:hypothetical protein [Aneurinibacillus migulanus]